MGDGSMKWKWFGMILAAIVVIFLAVTLFNTFRVESRQPKIEPTDFSLDEELALQHISKALTFQTISYSDRNKMDFTEFGKFIRFLEESYPMIHQELELEKVNDYGLIYRFAGSDPDKKPIGLTAHYDVVPILEGTEDNWEHPPFSGAIVDGTIWGRGTLDDKTSVIAIMEAVEQLLKEGFVPERDIYLMFGFDEEIGGELGAKAISERLKERGIQFAFVLDEGGAIVREMVPGVEQPVGVVGIAEKGSATVELFIEGSGGHSSQPANRTNIGRLARAIAKLEEKQFKAELRGPGNDLFEFLAPEMSFGMKYVFSNKFIFKPIIENILLKKPATAALIRTTIAPTIFQAGEQHNALPEQAKAIINIRVMPAESLDSVKEYIEKVIDDPEIQVTISGNEATKVSSTDGWEFEAIQKAARNVYHDALIAPYLMFAGSDARHYETVSDNTYRFLPVLITSEDLNRMHGTNEHIRVENFISAIKFYAELIQIAD